MDTPDEIETVFRYPANETSLQKNEKHLENFDAYDCNGCVIALPYLSDLFPQTFVSVEGTRAAVAANYRPAGMNPAVAK